MRSKISCFNATVFRKNLSRFWPISAVYALIWVLIFPLPLANQLFSPYSYMGKTSLDVTNYILRLLANFSPLLCFVFGVIAAMAVFSYLFTARGADFMHALPIRRETLFMTNCLSGLCFFLLPHLLVFVIALLVQVRAGAVAMEPLLLWLGGTTGLSLFFFGFAVFCAMFTGSLPALPVFYGILNFLVPGVEMLIRGVLQSFLFGYAMSDSGLLTLPFAPLAELLQRVQVHAVTSGGAGAASYQVIGYTLENGRYLVFYAAAGAVFLLLALMLYRRRRSECAGDLVAIRVMRPVFKYGVAFCSALALGQLFYSAFTASLSSDADASLWTLLLCMLVLGFVGYFAAEMLLKKTLHVFRSGWRGFAIFTAALVLFVAGTELDLTGYEKAVPDPARVQSVTLDTAGQFYRGSPSAIVLTDAQDIARVAALHRETVSRKAEVEAFRRELSRGGQSAEQPAAGADAVIGAEKSTARFTLVYHLTDGTSIARAYAIPVTAAELADPSSLCARYSAIVNNRSVRLSALFPPESIAEDITGGTLASSRRGAEELTRSQAQELFSAVYGDVETGNLGNIYLLNNRDYYDRMYDCEITLYFTGLYPDWQYGTGKYESHSVSVTLETDSEQTIGTLLRLGLLSGRDELISQSEVYSSKY